MDRDTAILQWLEPAMPRIASMLFGLLVLAAIILVIYLVWPRRSRTDDLADLANTLGLDFSPHPSTVFAARLQHIKGLNRGVQRYAYHIMRGLYGGHQIAMFDYHIQTIIPSSRDPNAADFSAVLCELDGYFPEIKILPETLSDRIAQTLGAPDIEFDSVEFSKAFVVHCGDKRFAYEVCNPRMMKLLLNYPWLSLEIDGEQLVLQSKGLLPPEQVIPWLDLLVSIREALPGHTFDDHALPESSSDE